jgi:DNA-binding MurR/RpiR family transcriptional regulator
MIRAQMRSAAGEGDEAQVIAHLGDTAFARSFERDLDNLRRTIAGLDKRDLERAVDMLVAGRRVLVTADATARSVATFTTLALDRMRGQTDLVRADGDNVGRLVDVSSDDVVLAFTFPPYASSVLRLVRWAREREAKIIAVTDSPISPVGQLVDVVLPALSSGIGAHNTLVPALAIANALTNAFAVHESATALDRYATANRLMDHWDHYVLKSGDER